ncbi:MAG: ribosome recycling factor [Deltaproteobacteria bacterium]|nr:ribosome recycling factor [Deltaproteobacteria bacterium]
MLDDIVKDAKDNMDKAIDGLKKGLLTIRTGRANPSMLDNVRVDYYGTPTPLNQVANVTAQDARLLVIKPFEKRIIKDIEKAIIEANLGFNPVNDGDFVRVPMPPLSTERRKEYVKLSKTKGEDAKVAIRGVRRDANEMIKEATKEGSITQDDEKRGLKVVQDATDAYVKKIDDLLAAKEKEIMEV